MRAWHHFPRRVTRTVQSCLFSSSRAAFASTPDNNAFAHSLLLPKTSFPLKRDPAKELPLRTRTCEELYQWQWQHASGPLFVFHDGPPYANGDLHMGHALNKILKDIINRYHVSIGDRVHYIPGWDCHGLPIENKVLKQIGKDIHEVLPTVIRTEAEKYAHEQVANQQEQFRQFGIMAGWTSDTTYRTLDHSYEMRQLRIFQTMVARGMIYRHFRPVHYSPSSRSALAEAELEYKDLHVSHAVYVSFNLDLKSARESRVSRALGAIAAACNRVQLLVWTTTPWTLTANMAIAVNPEMDYTILRSNSHPEAGVVVFATTLHESLRSKGVLDVEDVQFDTVVTQIKGTDLVGASYYPLFSSLKNESASDSNALLPILPSSHVTPDSGTGLVHCAPAHGHEDYALFRAQGLLTPSSTSAASLICHVDALGKFTPQVTDVLGVAASEKLEGKEVLDEGGKAMVQLLRELGVLRKIERMKHRYPYDWKTDKPVIIMATSQWFANLDAIKGDAIAALQDVQFYPPQSRNRLESFIASRSEWCISRQRVWGVPIPALYHIPTQRAILDDTSLAHILAILQVKGVRHWWDAPVSEFVPPAYLVPGEDVEQTWVKGTDTMDVWFDSGTSWSMLRDVPTQAGDAERVEGRYADVCLEGSDQHRGWFQSQLLTAVGAAPQDGKRAVAPYGTLITHGMVLDEKGRKMSKSLGNILSPLTILNGGKDTKKEPAYGVEVLRLWAATVESGKDSPIGPTVLAQCVQTHRKIRNSARFILGNLGDKRQPPEERVGRQDMGLAERYALHKVHELNTVARAAYATFNFPKVVASLSNFANITLSSFYLDITKDRLYANAANSLERKAIITVMEQILDTMVNVMGPIIPQLAQEIHEALQEPDGPATSAFSKSWTPVPSEWQDPQVESDMNDLLGIRRIVLALLEKARSNKQLKSSLEAEVDLVLPDDAPEDSPLIALLRREENFLKELFIVSDTALIEEGSLGVSSPEWVYTDSIAILDSGIEVGIRVRPATLHKCPRCWTYTRHENDTLCQRCANVVP